MEILMASKIQTSVILILIISVFSLDGYAQQNTSQGNLEIISNPPGAAVVIEGEMDVAAVAPCKITQDLAGRIKVRATKPGYETWKSDMILVPGQPYILNIDMKQKTRFKAAMRSMFIPGWGQYYSGSRFKGVFLGLSTFTGAAAAFFATENYNNKHDEYLDAKLDFQQAQSIDERVRLRDVLNQKQEDAYDAETLKRTLTGVAIGLWAYNFLDALIFFPGHKQDHLNKAYPSIQSAIIGDAPGLVLTAKF
ncbi:MAG: PEGA domain-containing protein [candidate division Zixibacteria bacterium]|nr:PEGA domain-containing protein [candidate division Zixibacteria bacterium]